MISIRTFLGSRTRKSRHSNRASGTGTEMRSRRLIVTPRLFSRFVFPLRFSFHLLSPISQKSSACNAVVLPESFGPIKTTGFPNSISTSPKFLKLRQISFVSIFLQNCLGLTQFFLRSLTYHVQLARFETSPARGLRKSYCFHRTGTVSPSERSPAS